MLKSLPTEEAVIQAANLMLAMSNAKRLEVLKLLTNGEMAVGVLADTVGLSQSALSQHLAKLREAKLVTTRRDAQTVYYSCKSEAVGKVLKILEAIFVSGGQARHTAAIS